MAMSLADEHANISDDPAEQPDVEAMLSDDIDFDAVVRLNHWQSPSEYYQTVPERTQAVVSSVVASDERLRDELRYEYLPRLLEEETLLAWKRADPDYINLLRQKFLLAGKVVAADATISRYETLSLVGAQIAISRVGYHQRSPNQYASNLMYWGQEVPKQPTAKEVVEALRSRGKKLKEKLPSLVLDALSKYMERRVLLEVPEGTFKFIQGPMFPHAMLSGLGYRHAMMTCLDLIAQLIDDGNYATIVSKDSHRDLELLGIALDAGEYLIVRDGVEVLNAYLYGDGADGSKANYTSQPVEKYGGKSQLQVFGDFQKQYGPKVVQGILRAHPMSRPYVFYCNRDRVDEAVHLLLADAAHTGPRGFPMLLDLADQYCSGAFKASEYTSRMNAEFARAAGGSGLYQSERTTRD
jgi:hypothetical protein